MFKPDSDPLPKVVYHGTDSISGADIARNGIDLEKCTKGYVGLGFYTAADSAHAKSNYADFAETEEGVVLSIQIREGAKILDLRKSDDFEQYAHLTMNGRHEGRDDFAQYMQNNGIDGLYDNSFEGIVFYNPNAVVVTYTQSFVDEESRIATDRPRG